MRRPRKRERWLARDPVVALLQLLITGVLMLALAPFVLIWALVAAARGELEDEGQPLIPVDKPVDKDGKS